MKKNSVLTSAHHSAGFSLIELLVVVAIMALVFGAGIASFVSFNDQQSLSANGKQIILMMRTAQKKARVGDKPATCAKLLSYVVTIQNDLHTATLAASCLNGAGSTISITQDTMVTPTNIAFQSAATMNFLVLSGGVTGSGQVTLILSGQKKFVFSVDPGGSISEGVVSAYP